MKILFITDALKFGGKERRFGELLKYLLERKINYEIIVFNKNKEIFLGDDERIKIHFLERNKKNIIKNLVYFYKLCRRIRPDIVHSWYSIATLYFLPLSKLLRIKFIDSRVSGAPKTINIVSNQMLISMMSNSLSDIILANSKAGLKAFRVNRKKGYCIHNGLNFDRIENLDSINEVRSKWNIKTKLVVGMVATFSNQKDYQTYLQTADSILKTRSDITFLAVGDGPLRAKIMKEFSDTDKIIFTGWCDKVESIMNICNVGVLLTNPDIHGEGIPNALVEFMALRKPVIATKGGGTAELVIEGESGYLIEPKNPDLLNEKIIYFIDNPEIATNFGVNGKKIIETHFNITKMERKFHQLYLAALNENDYQSM